MSRKLSWRMRLASTLTVTLLALVPAGRTPAAQPNSGSTAAQPGRFDFATAVGLDPDAKPTPPAGASTSLAPTAGTLTDPVAATGDGDVTPAGKSVADSFKTLDFQVNKAGCATCGGFHSMADGPAFHGPVGCTDGTCIPGRGPCYAPKHLGNCTVAGEFLLNLYQCLCCPDPCYQPKWVPAANASFFADYARPRTVTRLRYDNLNDMRYPDRNQYFFSAMPLVYKNRDGNPFIVRGTQYRSNPSARLQQVWLYQEVAGASGSFFVEYAYRQVNPIFAPTQAGFGDVNFGTKSLLFDCEMLQVSFQFRTYTPSGNASQLLGTGHFSLEPSLLASLKLSDSTYFQAQVGNWIPLGGNNKIAGGVFFWFFSLNQVIYRPTPNSPLIATLEMDGWSFENGGYTVPTVTRRNPVTRSDGGGVTYFNIGPGLRQSICDRMDVGGAVTFATGSGHWADPWFRFEVRFLF